MKKKTSCRYLSKKAACTRKFLSIQDGGRIQHLVPDLFVCTTEYKMKFGDQESGIRAEQF